jgi:hypothetical protein
VSRRSRWSERTLRDLAIDAQLASAAQSAHARQLAAIASVKCPGSAEHGHEHEHEAAELR